MSDIYPQSPEDSMKELSEMHPLNQKLKTLGRKLQQANQRIEELETNTVRLNVAYGEQFFSLKEEFEAANQRVAELEMEVESCRAEIDTHLEELEREREYHKITQANLRQVADERKAMYGKLKAVQAVMDIITGCQF